MIKNLVLRGHITVQILKVTSNEKKILDNNSNDIYSCNNIRNAFASVSILMSLFDVTVTNDYVPQ